METFVMTHKYCGCTLKVKGWNKADAYKRAGLDSKVWVIKN